MPLYCKVLKIQRNGLSLQHFVWCVVFQLKNLSSKNEILEAVLIYWIRVWHCEPWTFLLITFLWLSLLYLTLLCSVQKNVFVYTKHAFGDTTVHSNKFGMLVTKVKQNLKKPACPVTTYCCLTTTMATEVLTCCWSCHLFLSFVFIQRSHMVSQSGLPSSKDWRFSSEHLLLHPPVQTTALATSLFPGLI